MDGFDVVALGGDGDNGGFPLAVRGTVVVRWIVLVTVTVDAGPTESQSSSDSFWRLVKERAREMESYQAPSRQEL
jgi:hypothetical protein